MRIAALRSPRLRIRRLLVALWREIPSEENGFLNNKHGRGVRCNTMQRVRDAGPSTFVA